jgi:hypothetical protein
MSFGLKAPDGNWGSVECKEGKEMRNFSPFTIALAAIAISFVWSLSRMPSLLEREANPLPVMAKAADSGTVHN